MPGNAFGLCLRNVFSVFGCAHRNSIAKPSLHPPIQNFKFPTGNQQVVVGRWCAMSYASFARHRLSSQTASPSCSMGSLRSSRQWCPFRIELCPLGASLLLAAPITRGNGPQRKSADWALSVSSCWNRAACEELQPAVCLQVVVPGVTLEQLGKVKALL